MAHRPDAGRTHQHHAHQRQAVEQLAQDFRVDQHRAEQRLLHRCRLAAQDFRQRGQQHRAEDHAGDMAHAAQHHHRQYRDGFLKGERFRGNKPLERAKQRPRHAAKRCAHGEGQQLVVTYVDAHGAGYVLVFTNGVPGAANARMLESQADENNADNHQHQQVVPQPQRRNLHAKPVVDAAEFQAEQVQGIDAGNAFCAVGDVDRAIEVAHQDADDFPKTEGDNRQIVAAQFQGRCAKQNAAHRRDQCGNRDNQ